MELGQRLRQARLEAGLSQRQLCGDVITRNMLSQIENGAARPSMDTLAYLAGRLGKPISFFLEEQAVTSPNLEIMDAARRAYAAGAYQQTLDALADYAGEDPVFDWERWLLEATAALGLARQAIARGQVPFAQTLLHRAAEAGGPDPYYGPELERQRRLLQATIQPEAAAALPAEDDVLLLRANHALEQGDYRRAAAYLEAAEDRTGIRWNFLRGKCYLAGADWNRAASCLHQAEAELPQQTAPLLEQCYRELGDYRRAYEYACRQR